MVEVKRLSSISGNKIYGPKFPETSNYKAQILREKIEEVLIGTDRFILGRDYKMMS